MVWMGMVDRYCAFIDDARGTQTDQLQQRKSQKKRERESLSCLNRTALPVAGESFPAEKRSVRGLPGADRRTEFRHIPGKDSSTPE